MNIIDDKGNLFGRVNIIDAMVVLLGVAVVIGGAALLSSSAPTTPEYTNTPITVEATVHPAVAAELSNAQPAPESGVVSVGGATTVETIATNETTRERVHVDLVVETTEDVNGLLLFQGNRLYVGQDVRVDLTTVVIDGTVVDMGEYDG